jgi:hypothetical protein
VKNFIIVDVDDTIFKKLTDTPIPYAREALNAIKDSSDISVIYVTGRFKNPIDAIKEAGFPCDLVFCRQDEKVYTPNVAMKQFVLAKMRQAGLKPAIAFDDSYLNILMYSLNNINAVQIKGPETWKAVLQQYKKK